MDRKKLLEEMMLAIRGAEKGILEVYGTDFFVETKEDDSPVTAADKGADCYLRERLGALHPEAAFLTEEHKDDLSRLSASSLFIIDPVDGTSDFVSRTGEFTTNLAYAEGKEVTIGLINWVAGPYVYWAIRGEGAWRRDKLTGEDERIHVSSRRKDLRVLVSRSHLQEEEKEALERNKGLTASVEEKGAALKLCMIAEGSADLTWRYSAGTKEWDTAPGELLVEEAGGVFLKPDGTHYLHNRKDVHNREGYIAANSLEVFRNVR